MSEDCTPSSMCMHALVPYRCSYLNATKAISQAIYRHLPSLILVLGKHKLIKAIKQQKAVVGLLWSEEHREPLMPTYYTNVLA